MTSWWPGTVLVFLFMAIINSSSYAFVRLRKK
jgi:hypothetical protein